MAKLIDITGKALSGEWGTDDETGNGIPVLRTTNFTNEGVVNYNDVVTRTITKKNIDDKFLRKGDIIIEKSGGSDKFPVGRVIYFDGEEKTYLFNNFTGLLRVKNQDVWYPRYVFYSLYANYKRGGTRAFENKTTGLHNLKTDDYVSRYEVAEIDKTEQILICEKLDKLYGIVKSRERELQLLNELIKARFVELFGEPTTNPMGWDETTIGDECFYIKDGPHKSLPDIGKENGGHPFISVRNIVNGYIDFSTARYISDADYADAIKKCQPEKGDMLYSKGGTTGIAKLIDTDEQFANWVHVAVLKFDRSKLNGVFFENMLNSAYCYEQSQRLTKGIANRDLVLSAMAQIKMYRPPIKLQQQFAAFVAQTNKSKVTPQKTTKKRENTLKRQLGHCNSTTHHTQGGFPA
ncbi:MAG: restriction endonuclease subunit S [Firmicutes bacterium]|nr:restriction endonuclease subunit S [Bacillota bacterium]